MSETSFLKKIWARSVPKYLGTYLAVGFGLLQFIEFMVRRLALDQIWVDGYLVLWLLMLPSVALLIYYQGFPAAKKGNGWKRALVPLNLLLVVASFFFLARSSDPEPAITETVTTTDAEGNTEQRIIPTAAAIQRVAIFELTNEASEPANDWWGTAYALVLNDGLRQRPEILTRSVQSLNSYYDRFDTPKFTKINLATQRTIAERANTDYFVRARYRVGAGSHQISGGLYRTKDGELVQSLETATEDPFVAVDNIKDQIEDYLPPPAVVDQVTINLPASALLTDKPSALESYTKGIIAFSKEPSNLAPAVTHFRRSVALDPSCAACLHGLADKLYGQGKQDTALTLLTKATKLARVLPEREQFGYKSSLLMVAGEYDNYVRLAELARKLYPHEYWPYASLEDYYERTYGIDSTVVLMEEAARLSDRETALKRLYSLYIKAERYDKAEQAIRDLDREFSDPQMTQRRYASLYQRTGQLDKARESLNDMMATDPTNLEIPLQLANLEVNAGNFSKAERLATQVREKATNRSDTTAAWNVLIQVYAESGRIRKALEELGGYERFISGAAPINTILYRNFMTKLQYTNRVEAGATMIMAYTKELEKYPSEYLEGYRCYVVAFRILSGTEVGVPDDKLTDCTEALSSLGEASINYLRLAKLVNDQRFDQAADLAEQQYAIGAEMIGPDLFARILRLAGRLDRAAEVLEEDLKLKANSPPLLLEKARVSMAKGDGEAARAPLLRVLESWKAADSDHLGYLEARSMARELGLSPES